MVLGGVVVSASFVIALAFSQRDSPVSAMQHRKPNITKVQVEPPYELKQTPPEAMYRHVRYVGPMSELTAWVSRPKDETRRNPAIVWIAGGFPPSGFPDGAWLANDPSNDQSAGQYMHAGVVTMYPTTRGMEGNAGTQESFFGEVADVVAAVKWLRDQPWVDPQRVFVGGHSTGATLALLVSASTEVAGVIALGPIDDVCGYGADSLVFDVRSKAECAVRSPLTYAELFRNAIVVEGAQGNASALRKLALKPSPHASYVEIPRMSHFGYIAAINGLVASKIATAQPFTLSLEEARAALDKTFPATRIDSDDGWSLEVPTGFHERQRERQPDAPRIFARDSVTVAVWTTLQEPVACDSAGSMPDQGAEGQCIEVHTVSSKSGTSLLRFRAHRGSALFVVVIGPASINDELRAVIDEVLASARQKGE